jgi:hypothetical protein
MAEFDRFDIYAAYNVYSMLWGGDGCTYENTIQVRLSRLKYRPADSEQTLGGLSENAREVYNGIVERQHRTVSGYVACACCGDDCMGVLVVGKRAQVARGTDLCGLCEDAECEIGADDCQVACDECGATDGGCTCTED